MYIYSFIICLMSDVHFYGFIICLMYDVHFYGFIICLMPDVQEMEMRKFGCILFVWNSICACRKNRTVVCGVCLDHFHNAMQFVVRRLCCIVITTQCSLSCVGFVASLSQSNAVQNQNQHFPLRLKIKRPTALSESIKRLGKLRIKF